MRNRLQQTSLLAGLTLLMLAALSFLVPSALFAARISISPLQFWLAAAAACAFAWFAAGTYAPDNRGVLFAAALAASAALFAVAFWLGGYFYDLSYDGQAYHQEAIIHLAGGWNPVYDPPLSLPTGHEKWINHYAKACEIASAAFFAATGLLEHSKLFNLLLIFASYGLTLAALLRFDAGRTGRAAFIALILAFNPVSVCQAFSFYVDGPLASLLLCMLALGALLFTGADRWVAAGFAAAMMHAMNIKFTAIAYVGVIAVGLLVALYMSEQFALAKRMFKLMAAGGLIGALLVGYNPYVTNTLEKGHPFYPLAGPGAVDVVKNFTPRNLERLNRFEQAAVSYFSESKENGTEKTPTSPKWPFVFSKKELSVFSEPDVAVSGFGPLFSGTLLLAASVLALSFRIKAGRTLAAMGVIFVLLISVFVNPAAWWARYVPQLWFVPLVCVLLGFSFRESRLVRGLSWTLAGVLALNVLLVSVSYTQQQWASNQKLRQQLAEIQAAPGPVAADFSFSWSNRKRFEALGIAYREQTPLSCEQGHPMTLIKSGTTVCLKTP